jgi:uncharacterized protein YjiS (DUF1127 family)
MTALTLVNQIFRALRNRREVQSLTELDDRTLADIGLLRTDIFASLARPYFTDPSKALKDVCCHWRTYLGRFIPAAEPVACC